MYQMCDECNQVGDVEYVNSCDAYLCEECNAIPAEGVECEVIYIDFIAKKRVA